MANKPNPVQQMVTDSVSVMTDIISGDIWGKTPEEIKEAQESLATVLTGFKNVAKRFDESLVELRKVNGSDYLKDVSHFRKPRETKENTTSLESLFSS